MHYPLIRPRAKVAVSTEDADGSHRFIARTISDNLTNLLAWAALLVHPRASLRMLTGQGI